MTALTRATKLTLLLEHGDICCYFRRTAQKSFILEVLFPNCSSFTIKISKNNLSKADKLLKWGGYVSIHWKWIFINLYYGQPAVMSLGFSGSPLYIVCYVVLIIVVIWFGQIKYDDDDWNNSGWDQSPPFPRCQRVCLEATWTSLVLTSLVWCAGAQLVSCFIVIFETKLTANIYWED